LGGIPLFFILLVTPDKIASDMLHPDHPDKIRAENRTNKQFIRHRPQWGSKGQREMGLSLICVKARHMCIFWVILSGYSEGQEIELS